MADAADCDVIDTRKPRDAHHIGGAIAVQANQIGHHVGGAILAAVDQQANLRRSACRGGGSCATTTSGGYKAERISETVPINRPSCATRISAERCVSPSRLGARAMCAPALTQTRMLRWRRDRRARHRILAEHVRRPAPSDRAGGLRRCAAEGRGRQPGWWRRRPTCRPDRAR